MDFTTPKARELLFVLVIALAAIVPFNATNDYPSKVLIALSAAVAVALSLAFADKIEHYLLKNVFVKFARIHRNVISLADRTAVIALQQYGGKVLTARLGELTAETNALTTQLEQQKTNNIRDVNVNVSKALATQRKKQIDEFLDGAVVLASYPQSANRPLISAVGQGEYLGTFIELYEKDNYSLIKFINKDKELDYLGPHKKEDAIPGNWYAQLGKGFMSVNYDLQYQLNNNFYIPVRF